MQYLTIEQTRHKCVMCSKFTRKGELIVIYGAPAPSMRDSYYHEACSPDQEWIAREKVRKAAMLTSRAN